MTVNTLRAAAVAIAFRVPMQLQGAIVDWETSRDIAEDSDAGLIVVPDGLGNVYVIGATPMFAGDEDIVAIKYNAAGVEQWIKTIGGPEDYRMPVDAVVDSAGDVYITAEATSKDGTGLNPEWATYRLAAADGEVQWERRFFGSGTFGFAIPRDMAIGPAGEIVVAGWSRNDDTFGDFGVVVYDSNGVEVWSDEFSSPGFQSDVAEAVAIGLDGSVVVVGTYRDVSGDRVVGTVKYDSGGEFQWLRTHDASTFSGMEDRAQSVAIDLVGNVYVAADGLNNFTDGRDFVLLKYAPDGTLLWDRRIVAPTADIFPNVLIGPNGNIFLSGYVSNTGVRLAAFQPDGLMLWTIQRSGTVTDQATRRHAVFDAQGRIAVLQRGVSSPGVSAFTITRYSAFGNLIDSTSINPQGVTRSPTALASDAQGRLFSTGWWLPDGHRDILTYGLALPPMGDVTGDGGINVADLLSVIAQWGACPAPPGTCAADIAPAGGDGAVNVADLLTVIENWS